MSRTDKTNMVLDLVESTPWVDGATEATANCGHQVWVSPGSMKLFSSDDIRSMCVECAGGEDYIRELILAGQVATPDREELLEAMRQYFPEEMKEIEREETP